MTRPVQVFPSVWFRFVSSVWVLAAFTFTAHVSAQDAQSQTTPAAGTSVSVKMIDSIDSNNGAAGQQYRATVSKTANAGNGVTIPQGTPAAVTLAKIGSGWSAQLSSLTINGQNVAVTSTIANVGGSGAAAQNAASAVSSVLGGFGHHANAASQVTAAASGARVFLPPGTTLNFTLGAPPAAAAPATASAPVAAPSSAGAPAPATSPDSATAPNSASVPAAAPSSSNSPPPPPAVSEAVPAQADASAQASTYFFCYSDQDKPTVYFTEIFPTAVHQYGGPDPGLAAKMTFNDYNELLVVGFKRYLEKKYSFKSTSNYPVHCIASNRIPPANMSKQKLEGTWRQANKEIVETGWTNKDVVPSAYCTSGVANGPLNYSDAFVQNGKTRYELQIAFAKAISSPSSQCVTFPDLASAQAERTRQFDIAKKGYKVNDTGWKGQ